ncbi:hypothetical protein EYF80_023585 [Liparis tanakae]|uniref:Uncharacterized protein n=1 Tax=Liparis tanakae TaxID=230148 RepID=A0A4Z2HJZ6_9TELE|nr:hypothetical protein EYF80_023585 [Liparis tanakae]
MAVVPAKLSLGGRGGRRGEKEEEGGEEEKRKTKRNGEKERGKRKLHPLFFCVLPVGGQVHSGDHQETIKDGPVMQGHTVESSRKGPINVRYVRRRKGE